MKPLEIDDILNKINNLSEKQHPIAEKEKLEKNLQYQGMLVENVSDAIISTDKNFYIKSWNKAAEIIYGWKSNEIIGKTMTDIIPGEYPYAHEEVVKEQFFEEGFWRGEIIQKKKDNTKINISSSVTLIKDKMGKNQGVVMINRDITELKKAEMKLKEETEKVKKYLEIAGVILLVLDKEGNIVLLNKRGYEILQYTEGELIGRNWFETCLPPHDKKRVYEYFKKLIQNEIKATEFYENSILTKSGEKKTIAWNNTLVHDDNGEIIGTLNSGEDITERKKAEAELRKTMKELKSSNTELEQFAYVASHDLQEPLRMVASFTQLLQDRYKDKLDEDANDFINYAVDGATRMQNLISDLLIFSRVGSRGKPFKILDMNIVVEAVLNNLRQLINETNSVITSDPLPVIEADEAQMIQLFQNLISNAIKFRGEENPRVHISGEVQENKWFFTVKDNGIGIENKFFDRIFIIFQRLHRKGEYSGTGIGLAVCKKIIQRHGGKIWVESELKNGSTFHFSIPRN